MHPSDLKYHKEHEWVRVEGDVAVVGISHFAQDQLGEVVYVDLPSAGDEVTANETFGEIESVKSVSELYSPVSGEIVEVNDSLEDSPETVNADPHGDDRPRLLVAVSAPRSLPDDAAIECKLHQQDVA